LDLATKYSKEFEGPEDAATKNWYKERLREAEAANDSFAAAFHLRQILRLDLGIAGWKTTLVAAEDRLKTRELAPLLRP
jgi:hypothetical protein